MKGAKRDRGVFGSARKHLMTLVAGTTGIRGRARVAAAVVVRGGPCSMLRDHDQSPPAHLIQ